MSNTANSTILATVNLEINVNINTFKKHAQTNLVTSILVENAIQDCADSFPKMVIVDLNQPTPNQPQLNQHKKKRISGLDYFRALEKKNREADSNKQAGLSPVNSKPANKQQKQAKSNDNNSQDKITKIDKYLVELKPVQPPPNQEIKNQNQPTSPLTNQPHNPNKMSLQDKIKKFSKPSSKLSPPKLPPKTGQPLTKPKPNQNKQDAQTTMTTTNTLTTQQIEKQAYKKTTTTTRQMETSGTSKQQQQTNSTRYNNNNEKRLIRKHNKNNKL